MTELNKADIYTDYHDKVMGFLVGKLNNSQLAEDICSDVFLKVYEKLDTFDPAKASISTWIYTITRNTLTDYFRSRRVMSEIPETLAEDSSVEEDACRDEMLEILAGALEKLESRERDIIVFRYYHGMSLTDIAAKLNISYSYVKVLHNKALSRLREFF